MIGSTETETLTVTYRRDSKTIVIQTADKAIVAAGSPKGVCDTLKLRFQDILQRVTVAAPADTVATGGL